jgi:putative PEP-CTERM system histidine kinase
MSVNYYSILAYVAALSSAALASAVVFRKRRSIAAWSFCAGMMTLSVESVLSAVSSTEFEPDRIALWQTFLLQAKSLLPGVWLCFSLTFSRGNYAEYLRRNRFLLGAAFVLPIMLAIAFRDRLVAVVPRGDPAEWWIGYSGMGKALNASLLIGTVLILTNLERTFRSAIGTMQWRIKFVVLGLGVIFGARIYTLSQALVYSGGPFPGSGIEIAAILIGCTFIAVGYLRGGFGAIDIYPSRAALHTSLTVLLAGAYLFVVGVLAQVVAHGGGSENFQLEALLILLGVAVLAVLLLSNRLRQSIELFISRHFKRPQHDFREVWSRFTHTTANLFDAQAAAGAAAKLISETFDALSVTVWLLDEHAERLTFAASTGRSGGEASEMSGKIEVTETTRSGLRSINRPLDLEKAKGEWAQALRSANPPHFAQGGNRVAVPLRASDTLLGFIVLADRVNAVPYSAEEFDLLECIGDQVAASLLNLRLTQDVMLGKELQAFQTISAFFVHDLKNAASTLGLMLQNLPVHFDDPAFREDTLRGIGRTADRINQLVSSLSFVREKLALHPVAFDLNQLVEEAIEGLDGALAIEVVKELQTLPQVVADRSQVQSVITNLVLNARDAVAEQGTVTIKTGQREEWATLSVSDDGCGMSPAFLRDSLFRPFSTTKKKGLGIGMFQSKMIVEAHGGNIQVTSDVGKGTTFSVFLPLKPAAE